MDEIEYKLNTKNSVLIVNAIDKLISTIKSKYKVGERQKFVLENEELKFLREKCSSKEPMVSLTACQGLLALVELGVLEIGHTMSTVVTLLPSAHNYSAIISTMAGLLILDLKSRLIPGQVYTCQFSLRSPQHPFITVLEKNKGAEDDVIAQMHALCTHPDYTVSSNSLELLRPVFLWLSSECSRATVGAKPWQLLLSLPQSRAQADLLLAAISCQQICNPKLIDRAFAAYSAVCETAVYQCHREYIMGLLPMLARVSTELLKNGRDPRSCYSLIERCCGVEAAELRAPAGLAALLLADNLAGSSPLYLHELFNLGLNIISKYQCSSISLNAFAALSLQWLHLPSYLTSSALKVASKILDIYEQDQREDNRLHTANLISNRTFQTLLHTDAHLSVTFRLNQTWERIRDNPDKLIAWLDNLESADDVLKLELFPFLIGIAMEKRKDAWYENVVVKVIKLVVGLVNNRKKVAVQLMPVLLYKIAKDKSPLVKAECLKALPVMAKTKENVPTIVSILTKLKTNKGVPTSFLISLYTTLAETQIRCFPYLQEILAEPGVGRADDLKWEVDIARALAVDRICEIRTLTHGVEVVSVISMLLNNSARNNSSMVCVCARALVRLWRAAAVAPPSTWRALEPKLGRDARPSVIVSICKLLSEVPGLAVPTPEYDKLVSSAAGRLWRYIAEADSPAVVEAACDALAAFAVDQYTLRDVPEVYRRTVKLPASYCKTPADAARKPEDVLDYVPCEIWPEVFKYTNQSGLQGVCRLAARLAAREVRGYRSGVYQAEKGHEPHTLAYLQPTSVIRGLMECLRKQATSPSYDYPEPVLQAILSALSAESPRPLPPLDMCFLHELFSRGGRWRGGCAALAAKQALTSGSARRFLENYLQGVAETTEEADVLIVYDTLPVLCRGMPPNTLRPVIEKSLAESYSLISNIKAVDLKQKSSDKPATNDLFEVKDSLTKDAEDQEKSRVYTTGLKEDDLKEEYLFIRQLLKIKECLDNERIHDANRTLLSQIVESYFSILSDDNVSWCTYVELCKSLSSKYLERMTSPSGWWECSGALLRKSAAVRSAAAAAGGERPLVWLNELIDAQAAQRAEQEYSLECMFVALESCGRDDEHTREWLHQLMARTQVAFNEMEDESSKQYLCDVFMLSVIVLSGHHTLPARPGEVCGSRAAREALLPAAAAHLVARPSWHQSTLQLLEWLCHTRDSTLCPDTAQCCQRAVLALRHTAPFLKHNVWKRLEKHFAKSTATAEDESLICQ